MIVVGRVHRLEQSMSVHVQSGNSIHTVDVRIIMVFSYAQRILEMLVHIHIFYIQRKPF